MKWSDWKNTLVDIVSDIRNGLGIVMIAVGAVVVVVAISAILAALPFPYYIIVGVIFLLLFIFGISWAVGHSDRV